MSSLDSAFQQLLSQISDRLSTDDVKSLAFMLRGEKIPEQGLENVKTGEDVFLLMTKHGLLSKIKTENLEELLAAKNLHPCLEMIKLFKDTHQEEIKNERKGPCNIEDDMVVEHFKETQKLGEVLHKLESGNFVTLSGLLGCGKSQLALKCALKFRQDHKSGLCWKVNCQNEISLLNSLKKLADKLGLDKSSTTQFESTANDQSLDSLRNLILKEVENLERRENLVILDDVTDETQHHCQKFKDSLSRLDVKVIVTTWNNTFCDERDLINVNGFTKEEAIDFLKMGREIKPEEEKSYSDLAEELGCHPLLLYGARTCMTTSHQKPKKFMKYLKGTKSLSDIDKMVLRTVSEPSENRELFKILKKYLDILKNDEGDDVFDMVLALQFLALDDIPVLLFDFLPVSSGRICQGLNTTNFLQAIQKFSFGMLRGEDDGRFITTHLAVVKTIDKHTETKDKVRILRKLLMALMWLMDKDNYFSKDYDRNQILLPHAISVLKHVEKVKEESPDIEQNFEFNLLLSYVYDIVGYTYNFFGILKNAGEHSTAARKACFALIGMPENEVEKLVKETCSRDEDHKSWETFADYEANLIFEKIKDQIKNPQKIEILNKMAKELVLNKYRGQSHIELLQFYLGDELEEEYILTEKEYQKLRQRHLAIPEDQLGYMFLFELILQVFYTFGRRVFYLGNAFDKEIARTFTHSLFLAHSLGKRIAQEYPEWKLLYVMSTELSGTLELRFDDKADLQLKTLKNLEDAAQNFKTFLETEATNFIFGIVKSGIDNCQHRHICFKRLVRCYTTMTELMMDGTKLNSSTTDLTMDETRLKEIHEKGQLYKAKLKETQVSSRNVMAGNLRSAEFSLLHGHYEEAESHFKVVAPEDMIDFDEEMKTSLLSYHELVALKGLTKCYFLSGQKEIAKTQSQRIKARLIASKEFDELQHFSKWLMELGLTET